MGKYSFVARFAFHHWRYRLGVQDAALSRRKPGFESRYRYQPSEHHQEANENAPILSTIVLCVYRVTIFLHLKTQGVTQMPAKRFMHPAVTVYVRRQRQSRKGKPYWGFEPVKLGKGRKPEGPFYLRHTDEQGHQKWVSAGDDYTAATEMREKMLAAKLAHRQGLTIDEADRKEAGDIGSLTVKDAVADFLKAKEHKAKKTVIAYKHALDGFTAGLPHRVRFVNELTEAHVRQYVDRMTKEGLAPNTVKNRALIVTFLLKRVGSKVKTRWAELPSPEGKPIKAFSDTELKKLFGKMDDEQATIFSFFLGSGCREGEVMHAEWSDVDFAHRIHTVQAKPEWGFTVKNHEARRIPLPAELVDMLKERQEKAGASSLIFPNRDGRPHRHFIRELKTLALRAGLNCGRCVTKPRNGGKEERCKDKPVCDDFFLHRFRKTFATRMHHAGVPLRDLQKILGHKSLETTELYLAESDLKDERIQKAADKAFSF